MKFAVMLLSAGALAATLFAGPASARIGLTPPATAADDAIIQVRGGHGHGHGHGWHGNRGHHYGWYRGRGNWKHRH
jgi:hypothetical protein